MVAAIQDANRALAEGRLSDARRAADALTRTLEGVEQLEAWMLLIEVQLLLNARMELARSIAMARRLATALERHHEEHALRMFAVETALLGDVDPGRELAALRAENLTTEHAMWCAALGAVVAARAGGDATAELAEARKGLVSGPTVALRVLPWIVRAELALGAPGRALQAAHMGQVLAEAVGQRGRQTLFERLAAEADGAGSPQAQQAVLRLVDLASATAGLRDVKSLLGQVCRATMQLLDVDRAFVVLRGHTGALEVRSGVGRQGEPSGSPSRSIVQRAVRTGQAVVSNDLDQDGSERSASIVSMGVRSVICAPLLHGTEALGVIYGDSERVTEHELKQLSWLARGIAGVAAVALSNAQQLDAAEIESLRGREVAHDVRNLLNLVRLSSEDIGEADDVPSWARELAGQATMAARRMVSQLEQVLSAKPLQREHLALVPFIEELVRMLSREAKQREVQFVVEGQPLVVAAAPDELGRAFANLLSNAIKYAPEGSQIDVQVRAMQGKALVSVRDRGPGIPEGDLGRIFESGHQARGAVSGYGLGLGIASRVVDAHGGSISGENHPEGGAVFLVRLPIS